MNIGQLKKFLDMYFDGIDVVVRVPGGQVYSVTAAILKSVNSDTPVLLELQTEKDLDMRKIEPITVGAAPAV